MAQAAPVPAAVLPEFKITEYEKPVTMYTDDVVNVRSGADTAYDKVAVFNRGTEVSVTGESDTGWYQISRNGGSAYIKSDYLVNSLPGVAYVFVGDSRTVQLCRAIGAHDYGWVCEVGQGFDYFSQHVDEIGRLGGPGTKIIINFGVNDIRNADDYVKLVNSYVDTWTSAGMRVYYSSVMPVRNYPTISNSQIEAFNSAVQEGLDSRVTWIDSYSFMQNNGFETGDGLHYKKETYQELFRFYNTVTGDQE
jgi:hypothetical protein